MLAGKKEAAGQLIKKNTELFLASGCKTIVLSCPICLRVFRDEYRLPGIKLLHHTQYINSLIRSGRISVAKDETSYVYHDPCELGRGCRIYSEPRNVVMALGELRHAAKERKESICCGGSVGSLTLNFEDRAKITQESLKTLTAEHPDRIVTACPLCLKTFADQSKSTPVCDIAQAVAEKMV